MWYSALAPAAEATEDHPTQGAWTAVNEAAQRGNLMGSTAIFPLEGLNSASRPRGNSTSSRALVQGLSALDRDLNNGHTALRDELTALLK